MFITMLSVITSVKDYVEIVHKLIESDPTNQLQNYHDLGAIITYTVLTAKQFFMDVISLNWLQNLWSLPTLAPNIASSMISEISVLDGYFHNAFTFLETPISYGDQNVVLYCLEKFTIGLINSIFLCLPTSIAHLICLRRFVMQGMEAGYIAGLGTIAGNILWIGSVVFGLRFLVIPWLSLDILRYLLGFILLVKYMWDSYTERRGILEDLSKWKIFLLNFLLAFTEQTSIYPFISNLTISSDSTALESFPANNYLEFISIHSCYLCGICLGSLSLLQLTCWFWENPAFNFYIWMISSFKVTTGAYYKLLNFLFLYVTMISAISSVTYFGLDYTLTNPLGLVHEDRLVDQKNLLETAFLNTKASDRNTRRNRGRHGRRERWKRRIRRYRTFDASLYDQGIYDLFTIEDLNYGFDRFWLRRKIRNHRVRFRFFPGPWMRSFKKQLARPRLESFMGPRVEFFRILFEQVYHPEFHEFNKRRSASQSAVSGGVDPHTSGIKGMNEKVQSAPQSNSSSSDLISLGASYTVKSKDDKYSGIPNKTSDSGIFVNTSTIFPTIARVHSKKITSIYSDKMKKSQTQGLIKEFSALRKFVRKVNSRIKTSNITLQLKTQQNNSKGTNMGSLNDSVRPIYSKRWKQIFSRISHSLNQPHIRQQENLFRRFYNQILMKNTKPKNISAYLSPSTKDIENIFHSKKPDVLQRLSKKDRQILRYKTFLKQNTFYSMTSNKNDKIKQEFNPSAEQSEKNSYKSMTLLHPIKFYLQKEQAFRRKLKFYGVNVYRNFGIENNAAYFRIMMKRFFHYYKPTLRWERTMRTATMRKARRKGPRMPRKLNLNKKTQGISLFNANDETSLIDPNKSAEISLKNISPNSSSFQKPTHFYSLVNKRTSRYRYQIYKDVLQHWYYTPFNRLLVKFDVDSFIRRQPSSYFLTKKEENLLHLRRFLLSQYYETLRWYTYMQHYGSMKARIGGTKSFANRVYNQQFMGTLKKIRHLFAITPSSTENTILKFDQPLYNEFANNQNNSILNESVIHEELLTDESIYPFDSRIGGAIKTENKRVFGLDSENSIMHYRSPKDIAKNNSSLGLDLKNQSTFVIREYLLNAKPVREKLIKKLLAEKNYLELTKFLFKGQKIRGTNAVTNERSFISQEKQILYTPEEKNRFISFDKHQQQKYHAPYKKFFSQKISDMPDNEEYVMRRMNLSDTSLGKLDIENVWLALIKKCQNQLYNQESLKLYLSRHIEKHNRQKQKQEKSINNRLERLKNWFISKHSSENKHDRYEPDRIFDPYTSPHTSRIKSINQREDSIKKKTYSFHSIKTAGLTTAFQKAIKEAVFFQKEWNPVKMNIRNNRPQINWAIISSTNLKNPSQSREKSADTSHIISGNFNKSMCLKNHLKIRLKSHQIQLGKIENDLRESIISIRTNKMNESSKQNDSSSELSHKYKNMPSPHIENDSSIDDLKQRIHDDNRKTNTDEVDFANLRQISKYHKKSFDRYLKDIFYLLKTTLIPFKRISKITLNSVVKASINTLKNSFKPKGENDLAIWRKQETSSNRRRKTRKTLKRLKNKNLNTRKSEFALNQMNTRDLLQYNDSNLFRKNTSDSKTINDDLLREKRDARKDNSNSWIDLQNKTHKKSWEQWRKKLSDFSHLGDTSRTKQKTKIQNISEIVENTKTKTKVSKISRIFNQIFTKKFKRKRSRLRRYRRLKGRGPIKKRTLGEKLKRQFKLLKKYGANTSDMKDINYDSLVLDKNSGLEMITKRTYEPNSQFQTKQTKQRRTRQRKHRFWKKHKKQKYAQNRRKQRKRRRYAVGKIRSLNKELKRIKSNTKIQKWWWQSFLPDFKASAEAVWQIENDLQIQEQLSKLSSSEILERDKHASHIFNMSSMSSMNTLEKTLQIGDKDYKPLAIPEALRIRENLVRNKILNFTAPQNESSANTGLQDDLKLESNHENKRLLNELEKTSLSYQKSEPVCGAVTENSHSSSDNTDKTPLDIIGQIAQNSLISSGSIHDKKQTENQNQPKTMLGINPIPFYAGWDESSRQFVVTNRLLSTKQAGYAMNLMSYPPNYLSEINVGDLSKKIKSEFKNTHIPTISNSEEFLKQKAFSKLFFALNSSDKMSNTNPSDLRFFQAPLKGMNAATTLYWQVPFTTYDPDQFFALGMDGFSPIGWRKFHFRYSKQTIKPILIKTNTNNSSNFIQNDSFMGNSFRKYETQSPREYFSSEFNNKLSQNMQMKIHSQAYENKFKNKNETSVHIKNMILDASSKQMQKNIHRRSQKRYKRVKKHPRPPVWFPSGPLTNQVLPVHYIYVFYKRARLPRDRYIRRRLRRNKDGAPSSIRASLTKLTDMTLRRRSKPRRKYHRKPSVSASLRTSNFGNNAIQYTKTDNLLLKRRQFRGFPDEIDRSRPIPENQEIYQTEQNTLGASSKSKSKKRRKTSITKQQSDNLRIRQLRRRVQRQVIRPIWRYRPRAGGFVWPGDYLRLEQVRAPRLNPNPSTSVMKNDEFKRVNKQRKIKNKKRRNIQEWQVQPKKYLLEKHNLLVLKKRLQKSQNIHKIHQRVKELNYLLKNK